MRETSETVSHKGHVASSEGGGFKESGFCSGKSIPLPLLSKPFWVSVAAPSGREEGAKGGEGGMPWAYNCYEICVKLYHIYKQFNMKD